MSTETNLACMNLSTLAPASVKHLFELSDSGFYAKSGVI